MKPLRAALPNGLVCNINVLQKHCPVYAASPVNQVMRRCITWVAGLDIEITLCMNEVSVIDWTIIATEVGALVEGQERGSNALAKAALENLIGPKNLREAVDHYIGFKPGFELVRSVLWELQPWSAMTYCYELYQTSPDIEIRRSAIELLRVLADKRVLLWVKEFLNDKDEGIQAWGFGVLDQLLWKELVEPEEAEPLLVLADQHSNQSVRENASFVREYLAQRKQQDA